MIIDAGLVMSSAQTVTASAASDSYIDMKAAGDALPQGVVPQVEFLINTTVLATGGASTTTFRLQTATDTAFTIAVDLAVSADIAKASLVAGYCVRLPIPPGMLRYVRAYYTVSTNNWTSGKVDARIILDGDRTLDKNL